MGYFKNLRDFAYWKYQDFKTIKYKRKVGIVDFDEYGMRMYTGPQGSGKTASMVEQLDRWHVEYPDLMIVTNFDYQYADKRLNSLNDLLTMRNGTSGVCFAFDEIQNEFSSSVSKDFPENLLSVVTMQRKQRIKILSTSQVFTRVAKPLREQCYEVCECRTFWGRWTRARCYEADEYLKFVNSTDKERKKRKVRVKWSHSFVQSDEFRGHYDTYSVIKRLSRKGFVNKQWYDMPV